MERTSGFVLDLHRLAEGTTTLAERVSVDGLEVSWPGLRFGRELDLTLVVARAGHDLDVTIRFAGARDGDCDRCLKPYHHTFTGALRVLGRKAGHESHPLAGQDGVVLHDGRRFDLTGELRQAVLVDIPIRSLCTEECRGLCPTCWVDRNLEPCVCAPSPVDPRWEALRRAREP